MKNNKDLLLINPPFSTAANPYIAIPVLAAYLKAKNIEVDALDLNSEFFFKLLTPRRVLEGMEYCIDRFGRLNDRPRLDFLEVMEMRYLVHILSKHPLYQGELNALSHGSADFHTVSRCHARHLFAIAATMRHFPEFILTTPLTVAMSEYNPYSSQDILDCIDRPDFYSAIYGEIIRERLGDRQPKCVGLSVPYSPQIIPAFQCAAIIKKMSPHTHVTMGGPCISIFFRDSGIRSFFDIVDSFVMDEGEIPLEALMHELSREKPILENVPGLVYLAGGTIHRNPPPPPLDIEKSPPPDYNVFPLHKYLEPVDKMTLAFRLSRGCYWKKCAFCRTGLPMTCDFQQLGRDTVYDHLAHVMEQTGVRGFFFSDDASHPAVLEHIARNLKKNKQVITWKAHAKISQYLTNKRCRLLNESGCKQFFIGVESFTDRILKKMKKGITTADIDNTLKEINGAIPVGAYMILGFPTETETEVKEGFKKILAYRSAGLLASYYYSIFAVAYGSDIWDHPGDYGISDIRIPQGQDLAADIFDFQCSGLKRERVYQLYRRFSGTDELIRSLDCKKLHIDGRVFQVRYDLTKIREIERQRWDIVYLPFVKWLTQTDETIAPLTPVEPNNETR